MRDVALRAVKSGPPACGWGIRLARAAVFGERGTGDGAGSSEGAAVRFQTCRVLRFLRDIPKTRPISTSMSDLGFREKAWALGNDGQPREELYYQGTRIQRLCNTRFKFFLTRDARSSEGSGRTVLAGA